MVNAAMATGVARGGSSELATARRRRIDEDERTRRHTREDLATESNEFNLEQARTGAKRADTDYARSEEDFAQRQKEEGFSDLAYALDKGVDPRTAMQQFNASGELKLNDLQFDRESGALSITDSDGETADFENTSQFLAGMGIQTERADPVKLGKDDRLVDPGTGKEVVSAVQDAKPGDQLIKVGDALYDKLKKEWILPPSADIWRPLLVPVIISLG